MTRRRSRPYGHYDVTVDPPIGSQPLTVASLASKPWFGMMVMGALFAVGFYYSTQQTVASLKETQQAQEKRSDALAIKAELQAAEQKAAREKLAETWQKNQEKNTEVLGLLVTRLTVSEKAQERSDAILAKAVDQLQQLNLRSGGLATPPRQQ